MGKKSKRTRNIDSKQNQSLAPASAKKDSESLISSNKKTTSQKSKSPSTLQESFENLQFEDPFEDEYEEEVLAEEGDEYKDGKEEENGDVKVKSWTPFSKKYQLSENETLEMDESAYTMHHALTPEWPSLSFSILRDSLGDSRTRFPHSMICAVGTQADKVEKNRLTLIKLSDLSKTNMKNKDDDEMEKAYDEEDDENEESDDDEDLNPTLEHISIKHNGGVNRVRAMPQMPNIVATWSDIGNVYMYNVESALDTFQRSAGLPTKSKSSINSHKSPFFTYQGHSTEGYAMDWSPVTAGQFATGDCNGSIHLWSPDQIGKGSYSTSSFEIVKDAYKYSAKESVEDIQWSPTESTVLASAHCHGELKIFDTRRTKQSMLTHSTTAGGVDLNVIAWNHNVSNLLATGADDGVFSVWDLRTFSSNSSKVEPLARFTCHNTPITSLQWHPTDESMILVSDDNGAYVYDLSIETDDVDEAKNAIGNDDEDEEIPPQLLFVHAGQNLVKECHWHPQIPSLIMSTAQTGFSVFVPSNL